MKKILVIEDNPAVNENLCEILELSGYEVVSAPDGKKGVQAASNNQPDLILCDVMMPHLDGFGVLNILSQNERTAHIPLIFLTAKSEMIDLRKGMNLGAADYILKPFDDVDLLQSIAIRLAKHNPIPSISNLRSQGITGLNIDEKISELKKDWIDKYETRLYPAKTNIYNHSKHPRCIFFITKGIVRIHKSNDIGKRITLNIANSNTLIGEYSAIQNTPYQDDASALTECEIIHIPVQYFLDLLQKDYTFATYCYLSSLARFEDIATSYLEMAYGSVRKKVALSLIKFANAHYDNSLKNGSSIYLPREELAELVGSAKETIIRTLSDFKSEGLIELDNNKIVITNLDKLIHMPN